MFFDIGRIVLTSCRSVVPEWDLPLKIDICLCQHLTTLKVLHLAKKESHRLTAAHCMSYNICLTSVNSISKYDLQLKCMSVCCSGPLTGSHLLVLLLSVSFIRVFSPINIPSFLRKRFTQACSSITFAVSQLLISRLSSTAKPIVVEHIYLTPELWCWHQRIFIYKFSNFYIGYVYWNFCTIMFIFLGVIEENKGVVFLLQHLVNCVQKK